MSIDRRTSKQSKCISCRTKTNSWIHLFVTVQQTKIKLQYFSKTHKYIKQNPLTWQQFRNLLLPTQKWSAVWAPISSKRYSIGIHSWHPSFPWHCMAIMCKKQKWERIGCFYQCHLTAQLLPSSLQCISGDVHKHGVMTHLQIRVPDTPQTKHMFCELVPVKTLIASHNKQEKKKNNNTKNVFYKLCKYSVKLNYCHIDCEVRADRNYRIYKWWSQCLPGLCCFFCAELHSH